MSDTSGMTSTATLTALLDQRGIGHRTALNLVLHALSVDAFTHDVFTRVEGGDWESALENAAARIEADRSQGIETIGFFDRRYPDALRTIADPPAAIWVAGDIRLLGQTRTVAIVGTREPSRFGVGAAQALAKRAAERDWCVVSGLAKGVDTIAHLTALEAGGATVAVLAGGLDLIYPAENRQLADAIKSGRGALVSETRTGVRPRAAAFVARDRLQTALSRAVVICQTGVTGGSLHTARFAAIQGVPVFCPSPSEPRTDKSEGLRVLLEESGNSLCDRFREWEGSKALCRRLGAEPLAHPINGTGGVDEFFDHLNEMVSTSPVRSPYGASEHADPPWTELWGGEPGSDFTEARAGQESLFG